jgi:hypothetical protein
LPLHSSTTKARWLPPPSTAQTTVVLTTSTSTKKILGWFPREQQRILPTRSEGICQRRWQPHLNSPNKRGFAHPTSSTKKIYRGKLFKFHLLKSVLRKACLQDLNQRNWYETSSFVQDISLRLALFLTWSLVLGTPQ